MLIPYAAFSFERFGWQSLNAYEPVVNLSVMKSDSPDPVVAGGTLTYTVVVVNQGPDDATGVTLSDELPDSVTFRAATPTQGSCNMTSTLTCDLEGLLADDSITVTIVVTPGTAGTITNTVGVTGNEEDPDAGDDTATVSTTVEAPACTDVTSVTLSLLTSGTIYTDTAVAFSADIQPDDATMPYTYTIDYGDGDSTTAISSADPLTAPLAHSFTAAGTYTVEIAAWNCAMTETEAVTDTVTLTIHESDACIGITDAAIRGPKVGFTDTLYTFIGVVTPTIATPPFTTTWSPAPEIGQGTAVASYRWETPGTKSISMTVENCGASGDAQSLDTTHAITLSTTPPAGDAYEIDDVCRQARPIPTDGTIQEHTFHDVGDSDWVAFQAISGTEYLIEAVTPSDSHADVALELYDDCDDLPSDDQDHAFSPDVRLRFTAVADGLLYLHAVNSYADQAGPDVSYHLSVRSLAETATQGAVVIVAGRLRLDDTLQNNIHNVTNQVYNLFLAHGYDKSRIYYLATNTSLDADGNGYDDDVDLKSNRSNLEKALTQWATAPSLGLGPERAFTLYLMDHGGVDRFYLDGSSQTVDPEDLDAWLDTLEAAAPGVRINVIMEACHSGSFVPALSQEGRVVIASTATYAVAYATQQGARFSDTFLASLERGLSLYNSFEEARWTAETAHPDQTPWLDDSGDGVWNPAVDGEEAARRGFAYAGTFDPTEEQWPPYIVWAQVDTEGGDRIIRAKVEDNHGNGGVSFVWAVIYKPSYMPPPPSETEELPQEDLPTVQLQDQDGDGIWGAIYEGFAEMGTYRLVIYAADDEDLDAQPKQLTLQIGGHSIYLPLVLRQ
jgi:uncharacterized repeat protein (TIGR01451 family)